jgi:preprotein translocase subunit SecG
MMAACTGALTEVIPTMKDEILALAGASNLLTYATGLYAGLFIALPIVEKLYNATAGKNDIATANKKEA